MNLHKLIAFIPARKNSKRLLDKNIKNLRGHPLIAYTIQSAIQSKIFSRIICITDDSEYKKIAEYYGAEVPALRPKYTSTDNSPDLSWVKWILKYLKRDLYRYDAFCILRPTSPLRKKRMYDQALKIFNSNEKIDSVRAVSLCKEHPGKMWKITSSGLMKPLIDKQIKKVPWHSNQYAKLPKIYTQNASLEISKISNVLKKNSISGDSIAPLITTDTDGFDINSQEDWKLLDQTIKENPSRLKKIKKKSYFKK